MTLARVLRKCNSCAKWPAKVTQPLFTPVCGERRNVHNITRVCDVRCICNRGRKKKEKCNVAGTVKW